MNSTEATYWEPYSIQKEIFRYAHFEVFQALGLGSTINRSVMDIMEKDENPQSLWIHPQYSKRYRFSTKGNQYEAHRTLDIMPFEEDPDKSDFIFTRGYCDFDGSVFDVLTIEADPRKQISIRRVINNHAPLEKNAARSLDDIEQHSFHIFNRINRNYFLNQAKEAQLSDMRFTTVGLTFYLNTSSVRLELAKESQQHIFDLGENGYFTVSKSERPIHTTLALNAISFAPLVEILRPDR